MSQRIHSYLCGTGVALITPFSQGKIDYQALERLINHVIADGDGVEYIVCLGTTGESITLSHAERLDVLRFTIKITAERVPIVAGFFGGNNTQSLVDRLHATALDGVDAILSSSPNYNKPTQEGIYSHYMAMAQASPLPIIIYNVPSRTASNVEPDTIIRLANDSPKFVAVKEASGVIGQSMRIIKHCPKHFLVLSGDDPITLPIIACGGHGVISVIANAYPREFSAMVRAALADDMPTARRLNNLLLDVHKWLYIENNPAGIKGATEILGLCSRETRLPIAPLSESVLQSLRTEMNLIAKI